MSTSYTLESIIQKLYNSIMSGNLPPFYNKKSHLASLVLAEMYEIYESNKEIAVVAELNFFLSIKNPIKHILNILENSSPSSGMSIKDAIRNEYITIRTYEELNDKPITLLQIINDELRKAKAKSNNYLKNYASIASSIIDKLYEYRVNGKLNNDGYLALSQIDLKESLMKIIEMSNSDLNIEDLVISFYKKIDDMKFNNSDNLDYILSRLREDIHGIVQGECIKLHEHVGHVGKTTYEVIVDKFVNEQQDQIRNNTSMIPQGRSRMSKLSRNRDPSEY